MLGLVSEDGTAQVTPVWITRDGDTPVFNTVTAAAKERNMRRDPRVTLTIVDPENGYSYVELRGRVEFEEGQAANDTIDALAKKYIDQDKYPWTQPGDVRVNLPHDRRARARDVMSGPAHPHRRARRASALHVPADARRLAARRGRGRRHALHLGSLLPALRRPRRRALRVLEPARRDGRGDGAHPLRRARDLQLVPQPEPARRHGAHGRSDLRRPPDPRARLGLVRARLRRVRLRVRHARSRACRRSATRCR